MVTRRIETSELVETTRRIARDRLLSRPDDSLFLFLAAAELERLAYPSSHLANSLGADPM